MNAVPCPLCNGSGRYYIPPTSGSTYINRYYRACHGCSGRGWVEVNEDNPPSRKRGVGKK